MMYKSNEFLSYDNHGFYNRIYVNNRSISNYLYFLVVPGLILYGIVKLFDYFDESNQEKIMNKTFNNLVSILNKAFEAYKNKQYEKFFKYLSKPYNDNLSLITFKNNKLKIKHKEIITQLIKYNFKPFFPASSMDMFTFVHFSLNLGF